MPGTLDRPDLARTLGATALAAALAAPASSSLITELIALDLHAGPPTLIEPGELESAPAPMLGDLARAENALGVVVGVSFASGRGVPFRSLDTGGFESMPMPAGWLHGEALGVNRAGFAVGSGQFLRDGWLLSDAAFLWTPSGEVIVLDDLLVGRPEFAGVTLLVAGAIDDAYTITGLADTPAGLTNFTLRIDYHMPTPGTAALLTVGVLVFARRRRRAA